MYCLCEWICTCNTMYMSVNYTTYYVLCIVCMTVRTCGCLQYYDCNGYEYRIGWLHVIEHYFNSVYVRGCACE